MSKRILVIAAHPDDELLGCGGTLALHAQQGDLVTALIICEGESVRYGSNGAKQAQAVQCVADKLGIRESRLIGFPDQKLDTFPLMDIVTPLELVVEEIRPNIIYCQYGGDINRDHELLFKAILVAVRPIVDCIEAIYAFDTASSTEWAYPRSFTPDTWVDISTTLKIKLEAMACYASEVCDYPHPRSLRSLEYRARAWGNQCCLDAAEVFMTIRRVYSNGKTPT